MRGGSANSYDYANQDPIGNQDLQGRSYSAGDRPSAGSGAPKSKRRARRSRTPEILLLEGAYGLGWMNFRLAILETWSTGGATLYVTSSNGSVEYTQRISHDGSATRVLTVDLPPNFAVELYVRLVGDNGKVYNKTFVIREHVYEE